MVETVPWKSISSHDLRLTWNFMINYSIACQIVLVTSIESTDADLISR